MTLSSPDRRRCLQTPPPLPSAGTAGSKTVGHGSKTFPARCKGAPTSTQITARSVSIDQASVTAKVEPAISQWSRIARLPRLPSRTAHYAQLLLLLAVRVKAASRPGPTDQGTSGPPSLFFGRALAGWTMPRIDDDLSPYLKLGLLPLLFFLTLACWQQGGSKVSALRSTRKARLILSTMALFAITSLFLLTALQPPLALGDGPAGGDPTAASKKPAFTLPPSVDWGQKLLPNINDPEAVDPQAVCPGYIASNIKDTGSCLTADLTLAGPPCHVYGNDIEHLTLSIEYQAEDRLHVEIRPRYIGPQNETWFLLPEPIVPRPLFDEKHQSSPSSSQLTVSWSNDPTFSFSVKRKDTGDALFSTQGTVLVYEDQFIEFISPLPENYNLYGLGEVVHGFRLGNNLTRTLYSADVGNNIDANIYGTHPVYLDTRYFTTDESGSLTYAPDATDKAAKYVSYTHGVFNRNAHGQEVLLRSSNITWRAIGGTIDLYFYSGPKAEDVMRAYQQSTIGLPAMQQYWTLGFHQCRWGYKSWKNLQEIVDNFAKFEIPLETIWADIDYMKGYRNFENDPVLYSYGEGAAFMDKLHANHQHLIPIVDAAIYAPNPEDPSDAYPPYDRGVEAKAFFLNPDGSIYYGAVWPGYTVFPDLVGAVLNGTGAIDWWISELALWYKSVPFDGLWIDMSEVASFCVGSCGTGNLTLNPVHPPFVLPGQPGNLILGYPEGFERTNASEAASVSSVLAAMATPPPPPSPSSTTPSYLRTTPTPGVRNVNWPPYVMNHLYGDLAVHATSPNATHHGGYLEYDFHSLFGHQLVNASYHALLKVQEGKRPFVLGRSTFAGSGKWAGHWGGDNQSKWAYMYFSISHALSFSIFGIPMFGVDTCGFGGNTNHELCSRWMQLSAFFPFYRNHNILGAISQEPYLWSSVMEATKKAMHIRYSLLPYMYTLMVQASKEGSTVLRALAWEFPNEPWLAGAETQFMLGGAVMVVPCLEQGASTVGGVFPGVGEGTIWYDWYEYTAVKGVGPGQNVTLEAPLGHIPVFLRGGSVVPTQVPGMTTTESRKNPWGLIVTLDAKGCGEGKLYLDDGESLEPEAATWVSFSVAGSSLAVKPEGNFVDTNALGTVIIMGVGGHPKGVTLNGKALNSSSWKYEEAKAALCLRDLNGLFPEGAWTQDWELHWE